MTLPNSPLRRKSKIPKSVWLPALLLVYLIGMTIWFAPSLIAQGEWVRLVTVFLIELGVIILLRIFLVKREKRQHQ